MRIPSTDLCPACNDFFDTIDDASSECPNCCATVHGGGRHETCLVACAQCGHEGCRGCLTFDIDEGEFFCADDCKTAWLNGWDEETHALHRKLLHTGSAEDLHAWLEARRAG